VKVVKSTKTPADNFLKVSNKILRDIRVTDKARGFFLTVMSLPPDWDYSIGGLCKIFPADRDPSKTAGREQIYKRLKELMKTGYVDREPLRGKLGTIEDWVYFFDPDGRADLLLTVKPEVVKPDVVKPDMAQLHLAETTQLRIQKELRIQNQSNIDGETPIATADDLRKEHPAIKGIQEVSNRYPSKPLWDSIIDKLGSDIDVDRLKECWTEWLSRGYKPTNLAWALEWYKDGIPGKPNGHSSRSTVGRNDRSSAMCSVCDGTSFCDPSPEVLAAGYTSIHCPECRPAEHRYVLEAIARRSSSSFEGEKI